MTRPASFVWPTACCVALITLPFSACQGDAEDTVLNDLAGGQGGERASGGRSGEAGQGGSAGEPPSGGQATGGWGGMGGAMPASGASSSGTGGSVGDSGGERNGAGGRADGSGGKPPVLLKNYLPCEVELIIGPRCRNCHTPGRVGQEPFFDSYAQVRAERASILDVISDDFMPMLPPALTEEQKDALKTWVDDGAPPLSLSAAPDCGE